VETTPPTTWWQRWLPITLWLPMYQTRLLRGDLLGAATAWAIIVPESVAYAQIAGVPPQYAFYAAPVALTAYAIFGTSKQLVVGATSAAAILSASAVAAVTTDPAQAVPLSATVALMAGAVLLAAGIARLGFIQNFLAEPALTGFLFGMALIIVIRQLPKLFGIPAGDGDFFERLWDLVSHLNEASLSTMAVAGAALAVLVGCERFAPRLPSSLIVLAGGIAVSAALHFDQHGVATVGTIPRAIPHPAFPHVSLHDVGLMATGAFGVALVVFAESYSISARFAATHGYEVDADHELLALGVANLAAGIFQGFAVSGSASRTAAADGAGSQTALASLIAAVLVLLTGAFLTPLFTDLPEAVLGAIVIVAVRSFFRVAELQRYWRLQRSAFAIAATALVGVLVFDLLPGLLMAVILSLLLYIWWAANIKTAVLGRVVTASGERYVDVSRHPEAVEIEHLLIVRPDGQLFFGNVKALRNEIVGMVTDRRPEVVILDLEFSESVGLALADMLADLRPVLTHAATNIWIAGLHSQTRAALTHLGATDGSSPLVVYDQVAEAVGAFGSGQ
jgi:sulfate permease, SulP family